MKKLFVLAAFTTLLFALPCTVWYRDLPFVASAASALTSKDLDKAAKTKIQKAYGRLPFYFIRNDGQVDRQVKYYEKGSGHATFFTKEGVYLSLTRGQRTEQRAQNKEHRGKNPKAQPVIASDQRERGNLKDKIALPKSRHRNSEFRTNQLINSINERNSQLIKLSLLGANKDPEIVAEGLQKGKVNYFIGKDPEKWKTDIPTYRAVVYKEIYPGIDMKFYGNNRELEYDIIISPGADPSTVRLSYEGIEGLRVTDEGELEIGLKACPEQGRGSCKILQRKPYIYQMIDGKKVEIEGKFVIQDVIASDQRERGNLKDEIVLPKSRYRNDRNKKFKTKKENLKSEIQNLKFTYGFQLASYDKDHPIIIDPVLVYSTYLGGSDDEYNLGIAVDSSGNVYLTGETQSDDFPTQNPFQPNKPTYMADVFITKINPAGDALVYSTYLGGSGNDWGKGITADGSGNAYLTGETYSKNFPTQNPLQPDKAGGGDAFVTKITSTGDALVYSTYLGGKDSDRGKGIAVDSSGNVYLTGETWLNSFPTQNPLQPVNAGGYDAFVTKITSTGDALVYSTYLGGYHSDSGTGIAVDGSGNVYLSGWTYSFNFPTQNPLQPDKAGDYDVFITKINPAGDALVYSSYLGGSDRDIGRSMAVDSSGNVYLTGETWSTDFPRQNPLQPNFGGGWIDVFVTKINPTGDALVYSTYLGGSGDDWGKGITADGSGNAYLTGETRSTDFPAQNPLQPNNAGLDDVFITKINPTGDALVYSTYLGGSGDDRGNSIAVDSSGNVYLTGYTYSSDFPTQNSLQPNKAGGNDAFVAKIWSGPIPDIKANGSGGPVIINEGDLLSVTITLDAGDSAGIPADWYVCADSPFGQYHYNYPGGKWTPDCIPAVSSRPLVDLSIFEILNSDDLLPFILPRGDYTFCFDLDTGVVYSDCVDVTIQ